MTKLNFYDGLYFFSTLMVLAVPAIIFGICQIKMRIYIAITTILMLYLVLRGNLVAIENLVLFCAIQVVLAKCFVKVIRRFGRVRWHLWIAVILSIAPLCIYKMSDFYLGSGIFGFLGISYMTFKSVQIIIEIYDNLIEEIGIFDTLNFYLFWPTILSGPIDRSRRFMDDFHRESAMPRSEYLDLLGSALLKIFVGLFYKVVIATSLYQGVFWLSQNSGIISAVLYMYVYGFYLFFDFAGYSNMAIGVSYIFGIKTPENFKMPFISKDIKEFWDRWHISLSHWFRDFIFSRYSMAAIRGKWFSDRVVMSSIGFIINMGIMGLWHGLSISYIIYGLYHGVLLALNDVYQKKFKFHKKHKKERWYQIVSWFITFNLVMFGFLIFSEHFVELISK